MRCGLQAAHDTNVMDTALFLLRKCLSRGTVGSFSFSRPKSPPLFFTRSLANHSTETSKHLLRARRAAYSHLSLDRLDVVPQDGAEEQQVGHDADRPTQSAGLMLSDVCACFLFLFVL